MEKEQYLEVYRHSLAHILAKAVLELYGKETQYAIGPQIDDGFYYDFVLPEGKTIQEADFKKIEDKMREILKRKENWTRKEVSRAEALEIFKGQRFKTELIEELPEDETITIYYTGDDYVDLCRGPHVENSQDLLSAAFELRSVSGAYWRGDEHRDQMTRVYAYAFPDKAALKAHKELIREEKERDHKLIGKQTELFYFDPTAPGMPTGCPEDGSCSTPCLTSGEEFMKSMAIRKFPDRFCRRRSCGRLRVTGRTIRTACSSFLRQRERARRIPTH